MLKFDSETLKFLNLCYQGADVTGRRRANAKALKPGPGDTILDIGCGNGLMTEELARAVGQTGRVIGIDPSEVMCRETEQRCAGYDQVEVRNGQADALGLHDNSADKAVAVQVFEYLSDIPAALTEIRRVLRKGGRLVVGDMHYDCWAWRTENRDRMETVKTAWNAHFTEGRVPDLLPGLMTEAGFEVEDVTPLTITDHELRPDGLAIMMLRLMESFVVSTGEISAKTARDWVVEQETLAQEGRFFFAMTHIVVSARKI